ncbi:uncharacterized protein EI90DRAFT_3020792 [Cantharellus anzutake]|uniref:uncharacterized protein n=1 Tax=Cantharellus anzutake TaxID=1750568 RepID=UPI0019072254|nr:uncharacterized protein EI90DRAFT_3020792 [Cantharellus anzutake]KAF8319497.1 hypothetical protein EI90DRAFT_3020792 [Cantharellus anzutake]
MVAISTLFVIVPAFVLLTQAAPSLRRWPSGPAQMSEEEAKTLYNSTIGGSLLSRQQNLCQMITMEQLNAMGDALQDVKNYATANWGGDWDTITYHWNDSINPKQLDGPAQACYPSPMQFTATWNSDPTCSSSSTKFTGYIAEGTNSAQVNIYQGSSVSASTTVESSETQFTAGLTIGIPAIAEVSYSVSETLSISLKNTKGSTTTSTNDARSTVQDTVTCNGPANVEVDVDLQTCTAQGNVNFPVTLSGWVWFYYGSTRNGHYKWAVNLDNFPIGHCQQTLSISVNANTQTFGHFYGNLTLTWAAHPKATVPPLELSVAQLMASIIAAPFPLTYQ